MYEIIDDLPIPENLPTKSTGAPKYPFGEMETGKSFIVPYSDRNKDETDQQFKDRIAKSANAFARRDFNQQAASGAAERKEFAVVIMDKDDTTEKKRFVTGDAVVWRTK